MSAIQGTLAALAVMITAGLGGCSSDSGAGEHQRLGEQAARGEHDRDGDEHDGERRGEHDRDGQREGGEESGIELALDARYDAVRNGVRLILAYDAKTNSFVGTVENTTDEPLKRVRVEVHLSNGRELGPTTPADLGPGEKRDVVLSTTSKDFDGWTAHPEIGSGEHGHGEEEGGHD